MFFGHFLCYTGGVNKGNGAFSGSPVKAGESMQMLNLLYGILIAAGIIVPLFSLLLGGLDALSADLELGDGEGVIPFNFNALLFSLVVVGAVGRLCNHYLPPPLGLVIALAAGVGGYALIYRFLILPLKKSNPRAMKADDTLFREVTVVTRIPEGGTGEVELLDASGSKITYLARYQYADFEQRRPIEPGDVVKVLNAEDGMLTVGRIF